VCRRRSLSSVNTILHERQLEEYYCTLCYAVFDLKRRTVTLANSGLPYPLRCSGDQCAPVEVAGIPLGSFPGSTYDEVSFDLRSGDLFVFCTDGILEALNEEGQEFGSARLIETLDRLRTLTAREVVDGVFAAVESFRADAPRNDDMTAVAIRMTGC
jgi:sigma-B regulation protein RsbU (phosphoserine phosphatase)